MRKYDSYEQHNEIASVLHGMLYGDDGRGRGDGDGENGGATWARN